MQLNLPILERLSNSQSILITGSVVRGEFGNHHAFDFDRRSDAFLSPLMSQYWFFDCNAVIRRNLLIQALEKTQTVRDAFWAYERIIPNLVNRQRRPIPL